MPAVAWLLAADQSSIDRCLMQSLLLLSSSESARLAAADWLTAFDTARAAGATEAQAAVSASRGSPSRAPPS